MKVHKRCPIVLHRAILTVLVHVLCLTIHSQELIKAHAIDFQELSTQGELLRRIQRNFDRLEETKYQPDHVFLDDKQSGHWPGDTEGRTILGLIMNSKSSNRVPVYLNEIIKRIPDHLNKKGYMGKIHPEGVLDEQQLSGNGWLIRGLCEYYTLKKDPGILKLVKTIVDSLYIPGKGLYQKYPIDPESRNLNIGEAMGTIYKSVDNWYLSTDVGCVFIGMDGIINAYRLLPSAELKEVIDEMVERFLQMDLIMIKAQTHASLTAMRGLITYATLTNNKTLINEVEKRWNLYLQFGMMETFANYNWFCRYNAASEPCAIVDSYIVALKLWEITKNETYLPYLDLIYYNALSHAQRNNGGFGCDVLNSPDSCHLSVRIPEAHWCCTMRGADGLAYVAQSAYYFDSEAVYLIHLGDSEAVLRPNEGQSIKIIQQSDYPFNGNIHLKLAEVNGTENINLHIKLPLLWIENLKITLNGKKIKGDYKNGFIVLNQKWSKNDSIKFEFKNKLRAVSPLNTTFYSKQLKKIMYGPLLLGSDSTASQPLPKRLHFRKVGDLQFTVRNSSVVLRPVYHLMNPAVIKGNEYGKQVLFK